MEKSKYDSLPTSVAGPASTAELQERFQRDVRFNPPPPSVWKRVALLLFVLILFYFAFKMRLSKEEAQVIYADRYSREHKYRPAASPIITERLKDGRIRLRGAL